jgi:serine/threonine-protein kinase
MAKTHLSLSLLARLLEGKTKKTEDLKIETHLSDCPSCQRQLEDLVGENAWWEQTADAINESSNIRLNEIGSAILKDSVIAKIDTNVQFCELSEFSASPSATNHRHDRLLLDPAVQPDMLGRIGSFAVEKLIGRGGMGVVYKGFDAELNRPVAIKFLAPHLASNGVARQRFARESRAAAAVVHPNVVPIYSVDASPDRPYIVMAWISGRSLQTHVSDHGSVSVTDTVRIAQQIAGGLAAAHQQGLVHRDIKPGNILLEKDVSRVMITDFGLAQAADEASLTQSGWLAGTPNYMSPEQATGEPVDSRSDLFSLGSVMYFMLTGREPFRAEKPFAVLRKIVSERPNSIRGLNSKVPSLLERFIFRLLSKDPRQRFESTEEAHLFLTHYLAHLQNPSMHKRPRLSKTRTGTYFIAGTLILATALIGGYLWAASGWSSESSSLAPIRSDITSPLRGAPPASESTTTESPGQVEPGNLQLETQVRELKQTIDRYEANQLGNRSNSNNGSNDSFEAEKQSLKTDIQNFLQTTNF